VILSQSVCDQSTFENLKESLESSRDLLDYIEGEFRQARAAGENSHPCPGELELVIDLKEAIESLSLCCSTVVRNAVEDLSWGRVKHPRRVDARVGSVDSTDESHSQEANTEP